MMSWLRCWLLYGGHSYGIILHLKGLEGIEQEWDCCFRCGSPPKEVGLR